MMRKASGSLVLTSDEQQMLAGDDGEAKALAMRVIVAVADVNGASRLRPITRAHIDSCLYHGPAGLDFAERLAGAGGRVSVLTTLNVSALDLVHRDRVLLDDDTHTRARRLMAAYEEMGCQPTWTCAPYQLQERPDFGEHIAWAESNAIVFANSVLGARTDRYGDFTDICAALTGRVPDAGLHRDENRRARIVFDATWLAERADVPDELYGLIGHVVGQKSGGLVPAIVGLPTNTNEDQLKALGAAAASSGAVAMFHAIGVTPEAATLEAAGATSQESRVELDRQSLRKAWGDLTTADVNAPLRAVSVGTPHFSSAEFALLEEQLGGDIIHPAIEMYVSTGRETLGRLSAGSVERLRDAGIKLVVDTCTYVTQILRSPPGSVAMTNSAKWAWYAPGNLGVDVIYGSLADCVRSAVEGRIVREPPEILNA